MDKRHRGSCLCGAVRFSIVGEFERFFLCHCSHCRKDTGSAHAANLFSSTAELEWIAGKDEVSCYTLPGTRHSRCFCSSCGSAMPYVTAGMLVVPAGCLDSDTAPEPEAHIFVASKAQWDNGLADIPAFDTLP
jgi:hypothetical protein